MKYWDKLSQNQTPLYLLCMYKWLILKSDHTLQTYFSIWHSTSIYFLVSKVWDMLRPWNFLKNAFFDKKLISDVILNFYYCHQKFVSRLKSTDQSRDLVNDITNRHLFIREIPCTSFNWDTREMTHVLLYMHTILEKSVRSKPWCCFESFVLRYYP